MVRGSVRRALLGALGIVVLGCGDNDDYIVVPPGQVGGGEHPGAGAKVLYVADITLAEFGVPSVSSTGLVARDLEDLERARGASSAIQAALNARAPWRLVPIGATSFTYSPASGPDVVYARATFGVLRNPDSASVDMSRLVLIPVVTSNSVGTTEVRSLTTESGAEGSATLAATLTPTGVLADDGRGGIVDIGPRILIPISDAGRAALELPDSVIKAAPYAFKFFAGSADYPQYEGLLTIAYAAPKQSTKAEDIARLSVEFIVVDRTP